MFIEDLVNGGPGLGLSFHGLFTRKLFSSVHRIESRVWITPVPRSFV
jgi:hypothetical protein